MHRGSREYISHHRGRITDVARLGVRGVGGQPTNVRAGLKGQGIKDLKDVTFELLRVDVAAQPRVREQESHVRGQGASSGAGVQMLTAEGLRDVSSRTKFCVGREDGLLHVYDSTSYKRLAELKGHTSYVNNLAFSLDSKKLFSASDKTLKIWNVATEDAESWTCRKTLVGHSSGAKRVSESPCGKYLASGSFDKTVKVWDLATGSLIRTIEAHEKSVYGVSFEKGGRIISASEDGKVKLWNLATKGRDALKLEGHEGGGQGG